MLMVAAEDAVSVEWVDPDDGFDRRRLDYYGPATDRLVGVQAHMAVINPSNPVPTHCHTVDQFQVMFGVAGARFRTKAIPPVLVHYADAYSVYGPITTDDQTLQFLTLRAVEGAGILHMPADRDKIPRRGGRQVSATPPAIDSDHEASGVVVEYVIGPEDDGLAAYLITAGAHADLTIDAASHARGQYVCVIDGDVQMDGSRFGPQSVGWHSGDDTSVRARAGAAGCRLIVMTFPSGWQDREGARSA